MHKLNSYVNTRTHTHTQYIYIYITSFICITNSGLKYLIKAVTIASLARMTVEDSKKLLGPEFYPSWVLNWLNAHLCKIWPYVDQVLWVQFCNTFEY
ncbi:hypothetical protein HanLR1_Chr09g0302381 [Helianthus annuus]|nr:hypothetical protein HanLR1_Chr09g0302381 [Helianthus annuus]